jgi:hypothetical protein
MITSQLAIIDQAITYLNSTSKEQYSMVLSPNFTSSAGAHIRHIIDHYQAIISGFSRELIDYDKRERCSKVETSPRLAIEKLTQIASWIKLLNEEQLNKLIWLSTEVSVENTNIQKVQTSMARELIFASSHAVHHYAMIAQISLAQKKTLPQSFGLAPSTVTFLRQERDQPNKKQQG